MSGATELLLLIGGALGALVLAFLRGRAAGHKKAQDKIQKEELKAHDRINEADVGIGATDDERRKRLQGLADRWRN